MVPEIGPKNSNWFEFVGPVAGTGPRNILLAPSCEQGRGTGPCDQLKINQSLISILSSHNSARSCLKMAMPEQSSEQISQIEQNTTEQTVGINIEDWSVTSTRMVIDSSFIRNRQFFVLHHHQEQQSLFLRSSRRKQSSRQIFSLAVASMFLRHFMKRMRDIRFMLCKFDRLFFSASLENTILLQCLMK